MHMAAAVAWSAAAPRAPAAGSVPLGAEDASLASKAAKQVIPVLGGIAAWGARCLPDGLRGLAEGACCGTVAITCGALQLQRVAASYPSAPAWSAWIKSAAQEFGAGYSGQQQPPTPAQPAEPPCCSPAEQTVVAEVHGVDSAVLDIQHQVQQPEICGSSLGSAATSHVGRHQGDGEGVSSSVASSLAGEDPDSSSAGSSSSSIVGERGQGVDDGDDKQSFWDVFGSPCQEELQQRQLLLEAFEQEDTEGEQQQQQQQQQRSSDEPRSWTAEAEAQDEEEEGDEAACVAEQSHLLQLEPAAAQQQAAVVEDGEGEAPPAASPQPPPPLRQGRTARMAYQFLMARFAAGEIPHPGPGPAGREASSDLGTLPTLGTRLLDFLGHGGQGSVLLALGASGTPQALKTLVGHVDGFTAPIAEPALWRYAGARTGDAAIVRQYGMSFAYLPQNLVRWGFEVKCACDAWAALVAAAEAAAAACQQLPVAALPAGVQQGAAAAAVEAASTVLQKSVVWRTELMRNPLGCIEDVVKRYVDCRGNVAALELSSVRQPVLVTEVAAGSMEDLIKQGLHCGEGGLCRDGVGLLFQLQLLHSAAKAVAALHAARMAHLDIKPGNLLAVPREAAVASGSSNGRCAGSAIRSRRLELRCADLGCAFAPELSALLGGVGAEPQGGTRGYFIPGAPRSTLEETQASDMVAFATTCLCALTGKGDASLVFEDHVPAWEPVPGVLAAAGVGESLPHGSPTAHALAVVVSLVQATLRAAGRADEGPDAHVWARGLGAAVAEFEAAVPTAARACALLQGRLAEAAHTACCAPSGGNGCGGFVEALATAEKAAAAARGAALIARQGWFASGFGTCLIGACGGGSNGGSAGTDNGLVSAVDSMLHKVRAARPEARNAAAGPVLRMLRGLGAEPDALALIWHWCGDGWVVKTVAPSNLPSAVATSCSGQHEAAVPPWLRRDWWPSQAELAVTRAKMCIGGPLIAAAPCQHQTDIPPWLRRDWWPSPSAAAMAAAQARSTALPVLVQLPAGAAGQQAPPQRPAVLNSRRVPNGPWLQLPMPPGLQQHWAAMEEVLCNGSMDDWQDEEDEEEEWGEEWEEEEEYLNSPWQGDADDEEWEEGAWQDEEGDYCCDCAEKPLVAQEEWQEQGDSTLDPEL